MTTEQAEKRRKAFLKEKKKFGDFNDLIKSHQEADVTIYFDNDGNIISIGRSSSGLRTSKNLKKAVFKHEQTTILNGKNTNQYMIKTDPIHETVHTIVAKPIEKIISKTSDFLEKIEKSKSKSFDIAVELSEFLLKVKLSKKTKNLYKKVDSKIASIKGIRQFTFYITAENDPHYMLHTARVSMKDLLEKDEVECKIPDDLTHCDVYTMKIFDKYMRT